MLSVGVSMFPRVRIERNDGGMNKHAADPTVPILRLLEGRGPILDDSVWLLALARFARL